MDYSEPLVCRAEPFDGAQGELSEASKFNRDSSPLCGSRMTKITGEGNRCELFLLK